MDKSSQLETLEKLIALENELAEKRTAETECESKLKAAQQKTVPPPKKGHVEKPDLPEVNVELKGSIKIFLISWIVIAILAAAEIWFAILLLFWPLIYYLLYKMVYIFNVRDIKNSPDWKSRYGDLEAEYKRRLKEADLKYQEEKKKYYDEILPQFQLKKDNEIHELSSELTSLEAARKNVEAELIALYYAVDCIPKRFHKSEHLQEIHRIMKDQNCDFSVAIESYNRTTMWQNTSSPKSRDTSSPNKENSSSRGSSALGDIGKVAAGVVIGNMIIRAKEKRDERKNQ